MVALRKCFCVCNKCVNNLGIWGYLWRGLEGGVDSDLWHVPVVDVLVAVPHTVHQVSLETLEILTTQRQLAQVMINKNMSRSQDT